MQVKYPLEQLALIKQKKLEEAEREVNVKKEALNKEIEKLKGVEKMRDAAKEHKDAKLLQFREELDRGTTTNKIRQMKNYLEVVSEDLAGKEAKVTDQKKHVASAKVALEEAKKVFLQRQKDVEKLKIHREEWEKEMRVILAHEEEVITDEMGSAMHIIKKTGRLPKMTQKKKHGKEDE